MDRRKSLKTSGVLLGTALLSPLPAESSQASDGKTVTTVIDLTKCDGCRGALAAVSTGVTHVVFKFFSLYQIFGLLNVFLIGVWIIVAGLTARAVVKGEAFKGH